jgi:hypothetical protein
MAVHARAGEQVEVPETLPTSGRSPRGRAAAARPITSVSSVLALSEITTSKP